MPDLDLDRFITATIGSGPFQAAIRGRQALAANLTALANLTLAADRGIYATGVGALALYTLTDFGRTLGGLANAAAGRSTLGLGGAAVLNVGTSAGTVAAGDDVRLPDAGVLASVQTTDATVTTCGSYTVSEGAVVVITATVLANQGTGTSGAAYVNVATFRRTGGVVTQIGATTRIMENEDTAAWDAVFDVSGTAVRVRVTGAAATTIAWRARVGVVTG